MSNNVIRIFSISGGMGKSIAATPVLKHLRLMYPNDELVLLTAWDNIFYNNPYIKVFRFNEYKYFHEDYIEKGALINNINPYDDIEYRQGKIHLTQAFAKVWGIKNYKEIKPIPIVNIPLELEINAKKEINDMKNKFKQPLIVVQYLGATKYENGIIYPSGRENIDLFTKIVDKLSQRYIVLLMKLVQQPMINIKKDNILTLTKDAHYMKWFAYIKYADFFVGIDSSGQHMAATVNTPSVVVFGRTNPKNLAYDNQIIVTGQCEKLHCNGGFLSIPTYFTCKYNYKCMTTIHEDDIIKHVDNYFNKINKKNNILKVKHNK